MIKVLEIITTGFVSYGGLTTVAMNYYRNIDRTLFHIDFASMNNLPENLGKELRENGSRYYKLPSRKHNPVFYIRELRSISQGYDVVHVHANSATAAVDLLPAKLAGVNKRVIHIHNTTCNHRIIHAVFIPFLKHLYTDAIACSEKAGEWIFENGKFRVLNNAIDTERYVFNKDNRKRIRNRLGISENMILLGNVGKINEQKNHKFLLNIFKEYASIYDNAKLIIIGDGALRTEIEEQINSLRLKDKVILTGMLDDATPYYSAMDVFLFPSLWEGFPLSLLEAQANGLGCITSTNVAVETNVTGKVKYLSLEDVRPWCDEIVALSGANRVMESEENERLLTKAGFDIKTNARELEITYEGVNV